MRRTCLSKISTPTPGPWRRGSSTHAEPRLKPCSSQTAGRKPWRRLKTAILATGKKRVAHAEGAYHGTTLGALACMGRGLYRDDFNGVLADFPEVPFADLKALETVLSKEDVAAFIVEPIQIEAGIRIASDEYLQDARKLCDRFGALLIFDEVHTGMGRTGTLFGWQHSGVVPDIFTLAKALGGGMVVIGAVLIADG